MPREKRTRPICFVTGTRAEFGLMRSTLRAIQQNPKLKLQIVVTGMHLSRAHGRSIESIRKDGWNIDAVVPFTGKSLAEQTGNAAAKLARVFDRLRTDIVLIVGDRVEPFAAATAGHLSGRAVAHIHGGDRALGQVDDSLRHAMTKLSHIHFAATKESAERVRKMGEDRWRIHQVGAPGIDDIKKIAVRNSLRRFALLVLHPTAPDSRQEFRRAEMALAATRTVGFEQIVIVYPNNDPGSGGIIRAWQRHRKDDRLVIHNDLPREQFLGLMRDAAVLVGNSSSGIIEAASFGTPVVDIGPRQQGRERGGNVVNVPFARAAIERALKRIWNSGRPKRWKGKNVYGGGAGPKIASILANLTIDERLLRKLIAY